MNENELAATIRVTEKKLADPHIDVTFSNGLQMRFKTGPEARFAQELKMGETVTLSILRDGSK